MTTKKRVPTRTVVELPRPTKQMLDALKLRLQQELGTNLSLRQVMDLIVRDFFRRTGGGNPVKVIGEIFADYQSTQVFQPDKKEGDDNIDW